MCARHARALVFLLALAALQVTLVDMQHMADRLLVICIGLREFVFNSRHPDPRRVLGRCRAAVRGPDPLDPGESGDAIIFERFICVLPYLVTRVTLRCNVLLTPTQHHETTP